jgi:hypothetical protein
MGRNKFEKEREDFIRRSTSEQPFLSRYFGAPHPASIGSGTSRGRRRQDPKIRLIRFAAFALLAAFVISGAVSLLSWIFG